MSLLGLISKKKLSGGGVGKTDESVSDNLLNKNKKEGGFTIVEVMIVLAIAGLVLAIVFIAVPALQRNSRNTQRRSDLANLRAQFQTWTSNNNGKIPSDSTHLDSIVGSTGWGHYNGNQTTGEPIAAWPTAAVTPAADETITVFDKTFSGTAARITGSALPNRQSIHIWLERKCIAGGILAAGNDADTGGATAYAATDTEASTARAVAYVYQIEGEDNARCEDNI